MKKNLKELVKETQKSLNEFSKQWKEKIHNLKEKRAEDEIGQLIDKISHGKQEKTLIEISTISVAKATLVVILFFVLAEFIYEIRDIILIFFVALLFSAALDPTVDNLEKKHIPRGISIILIYLIIFTVLAIFISNFIPLVASQIIELSSRVGELVNNLTQNGKSDLPFIDKIKPLISQFLESADRQTLIEGVKTALLKIGERLQDVAGNAWNALKFVFNGIFNVILVLVITFFMTLEQKGLNNFIRSLFPARHENYIIAKTDAVKIKIGAWLRGQVVLSLSIGILVTIGLLILGVEYAATLGMIAAITEFIPYIGPIMAAIPALLIALNESPFLALWVLITYVIIQELENNILVPIIMRQAVGLSPIIIMFAMLVSAKFLGVLGIILAVPVTTIIWIFVKDYTKKRK
ncbi:AI-2E family transporter [Candidatus Peregrinibacteria bacterium]|nr:AI-2E family transporter [Candidatus Peregrinibacteria bacterium]